MNEIRLIMILILSLILNVILLYKWMKLRQQPRLTFSDGRSVTVSHMPDDVTSESVIIAPSSTAMVQIEKHRKNGKKSRSDKDFPEESPILIDKWEN